MLLMVEKGSRGGICNSSHQYVKANNKCMKKFDGNKESLYHKYWDLVWMSNVTKVACRWF